ncbi:hypothetical protein [uncultured Paracoccus sp.]|nr:hypothetical protein [uncultured Paracoccus sp.]
MERSGDPQNHVITGDALSPHTSELVAATVVGWLRGRAFAPPDR